MRPSCRECSDGMATCENSIKSTQQSFLTHLSTDRGLNASARQGLRPMCLGHRQPLIANNVHHRMRQRVFAGPLESSCDAQHVFVRDFVAAWNKVMNLDRYDLA